MVGRIGEALWLESEAGRLAINNTVAAGDGAAQPGLCRVNLKYPPARWIEGACGETQRRRLSSAQHKALIITRAIN
jgi:hypothetical protein